MSTPAARWSPSANARMVGELSRTRYEEPSRYQAGEPTQLTPGTGTVAFRDWVLARFPGFTSGGTRRSPAKEPTPGRQRDAHEEGIAVDFMVAAGGRRGTQGTALAEWALLNHEAIGVHGIVWNGTSWYTSRTPRVRDYTGASDHADHPHIELTHAAAALPRAAMLARLDALAASLARPASASASGVSGGTVVAGAAFVTLVGYLGWRWGKRRGR